MPRPFHRKFIAGIAVAALVLTAFGASQASARDRDAERALAALLGLAVIGAIIADRRDDDRKSQVVTRNRPHQGFHRHERYDRDDRHPGITPRPLPHRAQRYLLPAECLREVRTGHGRSMRVFGGRCLLHNYRYSGSLPRECAQRMHGWRGEGHATVWNAQCLHRNGYSISRR